MSIRCVSSLKLSLIASILMVGCVPTRQLAIDHPSSETDTQSIQSTKSKQFQALPGFSGIDGDEYYVRLNSEFEFKGDNVLKSGCNNIAPSYEKNELSSTLVFNIRNDIIKFSNDVPGFVYQSGTGKCNFKFDAKKMILTPWIRLDLAKETSVDYSFYSSANSDVDVTGLVQDMSAASNVLALTGVGMGVAIMGQVASHWVSNNQAQQVVTAPAKKSSNKNSSETHSLPPTVSYTAKSGSLNQTAFKVYAVAEGGVNLLSSDTQPLGELKIYPQIKTTLLLKANSDGLPDARDLSLDEISNLPIKSSTGEIKFLQMLEQAQNLAKPNLKPNWNDYQDVVTNCRKLKLVLKDLGFNKFDRNAFIYYFLGQGKDWGNYNINLQTSARKTIDPKTLADYQSKDFAGCLNADDFVAMKAMGLQVNSSADWQLVSDSIQKNEQTLLPLKSIGRQLLAVLKNTNKVEMERQLFPLLATEKNGDGSVLLQDHLGDFGLEKLVSATPVAAPAIDGPTVPAPTLDVPPIPGQGLVVNAQQLTNVFLGLSMQDLSCIRPNPQAQANAPVNVGILLFTTKDGSARAKGAALEFEFSAGKVNRIAFQLPTFRDFEQDLIDRPDVGGCKIDAGLLNKLH
jgi:hypothetical protein